MRERPKRASSSRRNEQISLAACVCVLVSALFAAPAIAHVDIGHADAAEPQVLSNDSIHAANRGEQLHLRIVSESAGVLHLNGYSLEWELESGATRVITVDGDIIGRFPFELHATHGEPGIAVGYLEVRP